MTNLELMYNFILKIYDDGLTTEFLKQIFNYQNISEINYIFRVSLKKKMVVIDVFDNISRNRFNRYFFEFKRGKRYYVVDEHSNVFTTKIKVLSLSKKQTLESNLLKLAYLFKQRPSKIVGYSQTFLSDELVNVLINVIDDCLQWLDYFDIPAWLIKGH